MREGGGLLAETVRGEATGARPAPIGRGYCGAVWTGVWLVLSEYRAPGGVEMCVDDELPAPMGC
eukprot:1119866-Amphidinium_carterae.1